MNPYIILAIYIILINFISFFTMKQDKTLAIHHNRRISEKTLFSFALILGGPGIWAGMYKFRHKTKHMNFVIMVPVLVIFNIICIYFIIKYIPLLQNIDLFNNSNIFKI
ncbi:MAG: DUF1294 domain-containing protein [Clostridia bacterium]